MLCKMQFIMRCASMQFQIFWSVVCLPVIYMVDNFMRLEFSPNLFFHNNPMFKHIFSIYQDCNVSVVHFNPSTFPCTRLLSFPSSFSLPFAFVRTKMILEFFYAVLDNVTWVTTFITWNPAPFFCAIPMRSNEFASSFYSRWRQIFTTTTGAQYAYI